MTAHHQVVLDSPIDLAGFRRACRALVAAGVEPAAVHWHVAGSAAPELFDTPAADAPAPGAADAPPLAVPAAFVEVCEDAILHRDPGRFDRLYRLLWRLLHEPGLRDDPLDADRIAAAHLAQAVRRDMHKMKAFVRFRPVDDGPDGAASEPGNVPDASAPETGAGPLHVAWFEPEHHIVEAVAPFFARRFTALRWAILTPERCVRWEGGRLEFGAGVGRDAAPPADAGERLWLTYYASIFNPARLKLAMMQKEMPRRYWKNLPEAVLIEPLASAAAERSGRMVAEPARPTARRLPPPPVPIVHRSQSAADAPLDLAGLGAAIDACRDCPIGAHATQGVPGEGPASAALMFVGEQPGDQEDLRGRPFVGPAGRLFDQALSRLGWPREKVYVTNAVKHFKFELRGKRRIHKTPAQQEAAVCLQWLEREIALVRPQAIVALGATAARSLMGAPVAVTKARGAWLTRADGLRVLITLHPSALLRGDPAERDSAFERWLEDFAVAAELMRR